jgi:hypothetical protein
VKLQSGPKAFLVPGKLVELPDSDPYVKTLVARGHLTAVVAEEPKAKETKPTKKDAQ